MRAFAAAALVLVLAGLGLWAGGTWTRARVDADLARDALEAHLEQALALPVELGAAELTLLPQPALSVRDARIGARGGPRLDAALLQVELSPLALLRGEILPRGGFALRGATLEAGALRLEQIDGRGAAEGVPVFDFTAASPRLGRIEAGHVEVSDGSGALRWRWSARGRLPQVELARLGQEAALPGLRGFAAGSFEAQGVGPAAEKASLQLDGDLDFEGQAMRVAGRVALAVDLAGAVALDLGAARVALGARVEKPAGVPLRIAGSWEAPRRALRLRDARIESEAGRAQGNLDVRGEVFELASGELDLAALPEAERPEWLPRRGRIRIETARLDPAGLRARGELEIEGEKITGAASYDASAAQGELVASTEGVRLAPLAEALWGRKDVSGRLYAHMQIAGPLERRALTGVGDFELLDGEWPGLSLARAAGLAYTQDERADEEPLGLDRFESIAGTFELAEERVEVQDLAILQAYTAAALKGRFYFGEGLLDLAGMVRFDHPDLGGPVLRPILRMAGTLDSLETHISDASDEGEQKMEADMLEIIRKVEAERRGETPAPRAETDARNAGVSDAGCTGCDSVEVGPQPVRSALAE